MNIKILKSLAIIIAISAVVYSVGFTISYFNDVEKSEGNVFSVGTLDFDLNKPGEETADAAWTAENWLPGDEVEGELEFENVGSMDIESMLMEVEIVEE